MDAVKPLVSWLAVRELLVSCHNIMVHMHYNGVDPSYHPGMTMDIYDKEHPKCHIFHMQVFVYAVMELGT